MVISLRYLANTQDFETCFVKGVLAPDEIKFWIPVDRELPDGTLFQAIVGFWRIVTIGFYPLSKAEMSYLLAFYYSNNKSIVYDGNTLDVVNDSVDEYNNQWIDGCELGRYFEIRLRTKTLETSVPIYWAPSVGLVDEEGNPLVGLDVDEIHGNPLYAPH